MVFIILRNLKNQVFRQAVRKYHEGQSTVTIINQEQSRLMINSYNNFGFRLNNDIFIFGPMIIFPRSVIAWTVTNKKHITEDSLSLFYNIEPRLDMVILGIEDSNIPNQLYIKIARLMKIHKLSYEILPTRNACTTFNYVNEEKRFVAGALIPTTDKMWTT